MGCMILALSGTPRTFMRELDQCCNLRDFSRTGDSYKISMNMGLEAGEFGGKLGVFVAAFIPEHG